MGNEKTKTDSIDHLMLMNWTYNGVFGTTVGAKTLSTRKQSELVEQIGGTYNESMVLQSVEHYSERCDCAGKR